MKKLSVALTIALSLATMVALAAQQAPSAATKGSTVTVTGCVEQASPAKPTGTSGDVNTPAPDTKFVLTSRDTETPAATSGTTSPASKVTYRLDDADQAKVSAHEGHKVQITGTVLEEGQMAQAGEEAKTQPGSAVRVPKLKVESVKMIASTCSQK